MNQALTLNFPGCKRVSFYHKQKGSAKGIYQRIPDYLLKNSKELTGPAGGTWQKAEWRFHVKRKIHSPLSNSGTMFRREARLFPSGPASLHS